MTHKDLQGFVTEQGRPEKGPCFSLLLPAAEIPAVGVGQRDSECSAPRAAWRVEPAGTEMSVSGKAALSGSWWAPSAQDDPTPATCSPYAPLGLVGSARPPSAHLDCPPNPARGWTAGHALRTAAAWLRAPGHCRVPSSSHQHPLASTTAQPSTQSGGQGAAWGLDTWPRGLWLTGVCVHLLSSPEGPHTARHGRGQDPPRRGTHRSGILTRR